MLKQLHMFAVRPYPSDPSIRIRFEGTDMRDGYPSALEIAEGVVLIDSKPFPDPEGQMVTLDPAEAGALVLTSVGMDVPRIHERLDIWFDADVKVLGSALRKLSGQDLRRSKASVVVAAFDKGVYVPYILPRLSPIRYSLRQRFFDIAARRAEGHEAKEIGATLGLRNSAVFPIDRSIASDLGLEEAKWHSTALVTVAGAAISLPSQRDGERFVVEPSLLTPEPLTRPPHEGAFRPLPEHKTHKIIYSPTKDPSAILRFAGQPLELEGEPDMSTGYIDELQLCKAVIAVKDIPFQNHEGVERWLAPTEMAALLLRTMLGPKTVEKLTGHNGGKSSVRSGLGPLLRAYRKLTPPSEDRRPIGPAVRSAFEKRLLIPLCRPDTSRLEVRLRERLPVIGNSLAEGKGIAATASALKMSMSGVELNMQSIRETLNVTTAGLVLITEAERWFDKIATSAASKTTPERTA